MYGTLKVIVTDRYIVISVCYTTRYISWSIIGIFFIDERNKNSQFHFIDDHYLKESNHDRCTYLIR